MFFRKKKHVGQDELIDIQWGAYYTSKQDGKFGVFRLLNFNKDAFHIQMFREKFDKSPSFNDVKALKPAAWHIPMSVAGLLHRDEFTIIGHEELDRHALMGYEEYMRQNGLEEAAIEKMIRRLMEYSSQPPMKVRLTKSGDGVEVTPLS